MDMKNQIETLLAENISKTSAELQAEFKNNPTGSIVLTKARTRAVKAKLEVEHQSIADSAVDSKLYPEAVCEYGEDGHGVFVKSYINGKAEIKEDD